MLTLDPITAGVHHLQASVLAGPLADPAPAGGQGSAVLIVVILVAVLLLGAALKQLGRAFVPIGELVRLVLSALAVAALLFGAIALLIGVLVVSAANR
jgi:hypothetical protein